MKQIPLSTVTITDEIRDAVVGALESGRYILADQCKAFEEELADYIGMKHCVLSTNWTAAVFLLNYAFGLKPGDEIIVPAHTAFPTIEPLIHHGAKPVFVDVDRTYCLDPDAVEAAVTPRTVGIIPVHLYGHPADMDRIMATAEKHGLWVLEDCAQAHGARFRGQRVGSIGTACAFSFYPSKNLSVFGDGGCIMTNDDAVATKVRALRDHGRLSKFQHDMVGFNLRFNELQAAPGRVVLRHLDDWNAHRRRVAARYSERLAAVVETPETANWAEHVFHMYVIRTDRRDALAEHLKRNGVGTGIHYPLPNHKQPAIIALYDDIPVLPRTEKLVGEILSLPIYGELPLDDVDYVCDRIVEFLS